MQEQRGRRKDRENAAAIHEFSCGAVAADRCGRAAGGEDRRIRREGGLRSRRENGFVWAAAVGSQAIAQTQDYILSELKSFGCTVETDDFSARTPAGRIAMKNILVKIPGDKPGIILLGTHYDTLKKDNFVGADDAGSSTGIMLELARLLCAKHGKHAVWIAFFDGEEAVQTWSDTDSRYGSREMAAKLAISGDLKKVRAFLLADIVGGKNARIPKEADSTPELSELVYSTAKRLGYGSLFVNESSGAAMITIRS